MDTRPLLAVSNGQALRFFFEHLRDVSEDTHVSDREVLYNASVLAHFATTSTAGAEFPATPASLSVVFDLHVLDRSHHADPEILEAAASQCLLLTGFFGAQQRRRHNVEWYASLGAAFYGQAAEEVRDAARRSMLRTMAHRFAYWRRQQAKLAVELRNRPRLIG